MPAYTALTPIEHDGTRYEEGAEIVLDDAHAEPLLALKAIELKAPKAKTAKHAKPEE